MGTNDQVRVYKGEGRVQVGQNGGVEIHIQNGGLKGAPMGPKSRFGLGASKFDGDVAGLIGISFLSVLLTLLTLGLAFPWAFCMEARWYAKHTKIDGNAIVFDGKGIQLFGNSFKWGFLCIVTLGVYTLWLPLKMMDWVISHTHLA